jgi:hypothetical protein
LPISQLVKRLISQSIFANLLRNNFDYKNIFYTFAPPNGAFHLCEISIVNNG